MNTPLTKMFGLKMPVIMAPMFLVSNEAMMKSAIHNGILGVFPSLNYRKEEDLHQILKLLNEYKSQHPTGGNYGVNLIVQKTNPLYKKHLELCAEAKVPFYITSLGNPKEVINMAHAYGAKVFCDVTNTEHAEKAAAHGCDGFIAVGMGAGGHAGNFPNMLLVPALKEKFPGIPVIAAGGVATGAGIVSMLSLDAAGVSIGTRFIASYEATVSDEYKQAILESGMKDIIMTDRLSGTPCSVINTEYAKKIGLHQNWFEKWMSKNPRTKKYFKMLVQIRGLQKLEAAVKPGTYKKLWCAGQTVELIHEIKNCDMIIQQLGEEMNASWKQLEKSFSN